MFSAGALSATTAALALTAAFAPLAGSTLAKRSDGCFFKSEALIKRTVFSYVSPAHPCSEYASTIGAIQGPCQSNPFVAKTF